MARVEDKQFGKPFVPSDGLKGECDKAQSTLQGFVAGHDGIDELLPADVLSRCKGIAILTVAKVGFLFSAKAGTGIVLARRAGGGWTAPLLIAQGGVGAGLLVGAEQSDIVLILAYDSAVEAFAHSGNVSLGGNITFAVGRDGRNASGDLMATGAAVYAFSKSRGLYGGIAAELGGIKTRTKANRRMYGDSVSPADILTRQSVPSPPEAKNLYEFLDSIDARGRAIMAERLKVPPPRPPKEVHRAAPPPPASVPHCACGAELQAQWVACPICGAPRPPPPRVCCGITLQPGWKACPQCGVAVEN